MIHLIASHANCYERYGGTDQASPRGAIFTERNPAGIKGGNMEASSPARLYCLLVGGVLVIAGIIGFFYEASFDAGDSIKTDDVFGVLSVNGWHNVVPIT